MLNRQQLKKYRELRGLTTRKVAEYCEITQPMITQIETGAKHMTQRCHDEIIKGINEATKALEAEKRKKKKQSKAAANVEIEVVVPEKVVEEVKEEVAPEVVEVKEEKQPKTPKRRATRVNDTKKSSTRKKAAKTEA